MLEGRLKIEPLARFTAEDIKSYFGRYDLPHHPLVSQGYRSIGCGPVPLGAGLPMRHAPDAGLGGRNPNVESIGR